MTTKEWPPVCDDRDWTDEEQHLWDLRYAEMKHLGYSNAPKTIEQLLNNHRLIIENVPEVHRGYFTRVLFTNELVLDMVRRIVALEAE